MFYYSFFTEIAMKFFGISINILIFFNILQIYLLLIIINLCKYNLHIICKYNFLIYQSYPNKFCPYDLKKSKL